jgi:hypothetical protein
MTDETPPEHKPPRWSWWLFIAVLFLLVAPLVLTAYALFTQ